MSRLLKLFLLAVFTTGTIGWVSSGTGRSQGAQTEANYKNNNCVNCHASLLEPLHAGNKYLEWQLSAHQANGVGCDKCHGGDPATNEKKKAHVGILPPADLKSRLNLRNQPETCASCHQDVVSAFMQSAHYKHLKGLGLGPACGNCHTHMATRVIYDSWETSALCARCHNAINFMQPRPEIPVRARETMMALQRAGGVIRWAQMLIANGQRRGWRLDAEQNELKRSEELLKTAQVNWHAFQLESVRKQADEAFEKGTKVKEAMRKKLLTD
jgi:nitrate/TMAO reductase-like tetraheme cytochrome c subunit